MTNIEVVKKFLGIEIVVEKISEKQYHIRIGDKV
jgi:hypothetical protein